ncbi:hypothetical protein EsH8_VIII_000169 [Colletotrichum jinshuiense]
MSESTRPEPETEGQTAVAPYLQEDSILFRRVPQEVRNYIFSHLFSSTRLAWGERIVEIFWHARVKPAPNALAILRSCRRAKTEIGDTWIGKVLFSFENCKSMLDKLTTLAPGTISKLRHMRVLGNNLALVSEEAKGFVYYELHSALKLLPGLRLDTLTVLGTSIPKTSYVVLDGLIRDSYGWRELRYISHTSRMLGYAMPFDFTSDDNKYWREPQPTYWQHVMEDRDGSLSGPSVVIYRSTVPDSPGSVLNANTRVEFEQMPEDGDAEEYFGFPYELELMVEGEENKELMVVVKRGKGVDYEEKEDSPFIDEDIRRDFPGETWDEIRDERIDRFIDDDVDGTVIDQYQDVDEIVWSAAHFAKIDEWGC